MSSTYRVRDGFTFGGIVTLGPGSLIVLNDAEAAAFLDKLERVEASSGEAEAAGENETDAEPKTEAAKGKRKG